MHGDVIKNILEYMNGMSNREFTLEEVRAISVSVYREKSDRELKELIIKTKTVKGKQELNERIAKIANTILRSNTIKAEHVHLYKRCRSEEYTDRTGKCAWGFKDIRKRLGFDEITGLEIV